MQPVLIFDVNETLLDVDVLRPLFQRIFGTPDLLKEWFDAVLLYAQTVTLIGDYRDFASLAEDALLMLASARGLSVRTEDVAELLETLRSLPPHADVLASLQRLKGSGFRLAALTNSGGAAAHNQLRHAGLHPLFDRIVSVDAVRRFKPAPETYAFACSEMRCAPGATILIAAHPWDVRGAMRAGLRGAFVQRSGKAWFGRDSAPEFVAPDLSRMAELLVKLS